MKLTAAQINDIKNEITHYDNKSLIGSLWSSFKQIFQATDAGLNWGSTIVKTESAVAKTNYLNAKLKELEEASK